MSSKYTKRWSAVLATGSAGLALLIAGCGGASNPSSSADGDGHVTQVAAA